jgi:ribosomal protein S18 acetylase RimI-like enzyme
MELMAARDAVRSLEGPLDVVSDSTYVVNCFRNGWWEGWLARDWHGSARQPVANRDLWEPLVDAYRGSPGRLRFHWVKGHGSDPYNDLVDRLAVAAAASQSGAQGSAPPQAGSLGPADDPRSARSRPAPAVPVPRVAPKVRVAAGGGLTLRPARPEDVKAVLGLWRTAGAVPSRTDDEASVLVLLARDPGALIVAEAGDELVGSLIAGFDGWRASFHRLAVHPDFRRRGVGRALVTEAEHRLSALGARRASAIVMHEDARATAFWEAVGYEFDARAARHVKNLSPGP